MAVADVGPTEISTAHAGTLPLTVDVEAVAHDGPPAMIRAPAQARGDRLKAVRAHERTPTGRRRGRLATSGSGTGGEGDCFHRAVDLELAQNTSDMGPYRLR